MTHACINLVAGDSQTDKDLLGASVTMEKKQQQLDEVKTMKKKKKKEEPVKCDTEVMEERNLDSGYAWLILAVMFLLASSTGGTNRVYGLIYAKQVAIGYYDHEQASWPIATASTVENLAGLMTPALAQFLTWRQIELLATLLFVLANFGAYFSDSLACDILCLGIIQGLALSINTVLSLVINNDYFKRYRTTAYGISLSGSTFGIMYLGPIVSWCLERDEFEFRSSYLAIGGVLALNAILVIFIRPRCNKPPAGRCREGPEVDVVASCGVERKRSLLERHLERKNSVASIALMCKQKRQSDLQRQSTGIARSSSIAARPQVDQMKWPLGKQEVKVITISASTLKKSASSNEFSSATETNNNKHKDKKMSLFSAPSQQLDHGHYHVNMRMHVNNTTETDDEKRKFYTNLSLRAAAAGGGGSSNRSSVASELEHQVKNNAGNNNVDELDVADKLTQTRTDTDLDGADEGLSTELVGALLRSPYLHCVWIMLSLYYLIARIFIIILVDLAKDNGLSSSESRALLNYWSLGEIVGRIVLCSFVDLQWLSVRACILLTCTSMSVCIGAMVLLSGSFYLYAICSALVAALISLEYVLINVLMIEYLGQSRVTSCYSVGSFISSLALMGRPALIGLFRDQLGSYNGLLLLLAAISLSYGLLFGLMEPLLVRYWPKRQLHHRSRLL